MLLEGRTVWQPEPRDFSKASTQKCSQHRSMAGVELALQYRLPCRRTEPAEARITRAWLRRLWCISVLTTADCAAGEMGREKLKRPPRCRKICIKKKWENTHFYMFTHKLSPPDEEVGRKETFHCL